MFLSLRILMLIPKYYKSRDKHGDKMIALKKSSILAQQLQED